MTTSATRATAHFDRLLAGSLSKRERVRAILMRLAANGWRQHPARRCVRRGTRKEYDHAGVSQ